MTKKAKNDTVLPTPEVELRAEEAENEAAEPLAVKAEEEEMEAEDGTFVYCGPSVKGVAKQYAVFTGGIPEALKGFREKHPAVSALIVPVERFAQMRQRLETKGTAEAIIYSNLKSEL